MLKVLIVDDETVVRRGIMLGMDWAAMDCVVVGEASNGEEGLAAAARYNPNLIITDVRMPRMDGIEMMRRLREQDCTAHFIVLTAYDEFDYARSALSKYVLQTLNYIAEHYADADINIATIARHIGISEGHLSHVFKKETNYTALGYLTQYRIHTARKLLRDCRYKVYEVAEMVGYRDVAYFGSTFKKLTGMSPSEYQDRCR